MKKTNKKGITLIALIITIIVMLILVGVTINVALNGGLFQKAKVAADGTQKQADKEELLSAIIASYNYQKGEVDIDVLQRKLSSEWTHQGSNFPYTFTKTKTGNSFLVYKDGTVKDEENTLSTEKSFKIYLSQGRSTAEGTIINIQADTSSLSKITFTSEAEAYSYLYDMIGIEDKTKPLSYAIETIYNMDLGEGEETKTYEQIKTILASTYEIEDPTTLTDGTMIKMLAMGRDFNNYTIIEIMELFSSQLNEYEAQSKKLIVNGQEIPDNKIQWNSYDAQYLVPRVGTYTIELVLDENIASDQITISLPEQIGTESRRLYIHYKYANKNSYIKWIK